MNKIKFIILMFLIIVLFQTSFLVNNYFLYLHMFLAVAVWLLGTRNIKKDNPLKKAIIYGFIVLWWGTVYIVTNYVKIRSNLSLYFFVADNFWAYQILPLFIMSKILTIEPIKKKIEDESPKFLIITCVIMFIVGYLITNQFYQMLIEFDSDAMIYNPLNITIFIIQLFNSLKIKIEDKVFTLISLVTTISIVVIINIIPILKINETINSQKRFNNVIKSNMLTYKNISSELGPYIQEVTQEDINVNEILFDYQFFEYSSKTNYYIIKSYIENINRKNFNENLTTIRGIANTIEEFTEIAESECNYRTSIIIISIILIMGIGIFVSFGKESIRYYRKK